MDMRENFSRKREAVLHAVEGTKSHPSAEWVYGQLRQEHPDISLATVYRNLKRFCDTGRVRSIGVVNGQERFDADLSPHSHFVCRRCGAVRDIPEMPFPPETLAEIGARYGLTVDSGDIRFTGLCASCAAEEKASASGKKS